MKLTPGRLIRIMADIEKYAVPMGEYYQREPKILTAVFHMIKPTDDEIEKSSLEPIQGGSKTPLILRNVYRPYFVRGLGMQGELLQKCFDLAGKIKMAQMCRTKDLRELEKLAEMFLERLKIDG
jgi:hypothetical protein